jgi:AraC family transcriptional regulator
MNGNRLSENKVLIDDYTSRINRVLDYIETHLDKQFTLEELASVSHFSKFHFSRIFWAMVGETPFEFIARIRLEKAATMLRLYPHQPVLEIAMKCGYSDKSVFSRNFKSYFNTPPSAYRKSGNTDSNQSQLLSNCSQQYQEASGYFCDESSTQNRRINMEIIQQVEVQHLPATTVVYVRHTGPFQGDGALYQRLISTIYAWAGPRGLVQNDTKTYAVYHNDPCVTEAEKLRLSICLNVPPDTKVDGEVGKMELEGGKYAVASFVLSPHEFPQAWGWLMGTWFPSSGYQPDDKLAFEMYPAMPENGKITVDICVPVKPM